MTNINFKEYDALFESCHFYRIPFFKLAKIIRVKYPEKFRILEANQGSIFYYLQKLEILCANLEKHKEYWAGVVQTVQDNVRSNKLEKISIEEDQKLIKRTTGFSKLLQLDVDSFFIFSRILLDRIPYLLEPFFQGVVTRTGKTPNTRGFRVIWNGLWFTSAAFY